MYIIDGTIVLHALLEMDRGKLSTPKVLCLIRRMGRQGGAEVIASAHRLSQVRPCRIKKNWSGLVFGEQRHCNNRTQASTAFPLNFQRVWMVGAGGRNGSIAMPAVPAWPGREFITNLSTLHGLRCAILGQEEQAAKQRQGWGNSRPSRPLQARFLAAPKFQQQRFATPPCESRPQSSRYRLPFFGTPSTLSSIPRATLLLCWIIMFRISYVSSFPGLQNCCADFKFVWI